MNDARALMHIKVQAKLATMYSEARQLYVLLTELDWVTPQLEEACRKSCAEWQNDAARISEAERYILGH